VRKQDKIILWPCYFDAAKTRKDGRRVPKSLAMLSPKILEIKQAAEELGLECESVANSSHPRTPSLKTGMLLVKKREKKDQIVRRIAKQLLKIRNAALQ
jgi:signal recognition particle subunit SRP19